MTRSHSQSEAAFARACDSLVGGVNSPVRAYSAVGGNAPFVSRASGSTITDVDGNDYIDYVASYGPAILGHAHPAVVKAVQASAMTGTSFGASTVGEIELAERVLAAVPAAEKIRFTNSGTEAVMTAVRLARGATGRDKIVKFIGCYHGHSDALLVSAGSGATTLGVPSSPGVPAGATNDTILLDYNDAAAVEAAFAEFPDQIAAVIVEPVAGNMGVIPPASQFLQSLRDLTSAHGALLIFDEVMTGFRVAWGGAQVLYGIEPDLSTFGKVIGGGMPVGAVVGRRTIMDHLAPVGSVYQAGTLSGNPAAMACGIATMDAIAADANFYAALEAKSAALEAGLAAAIADSPFANRACTQRVGSMVCLFFSPAPPTNYASATACDTDAFGRYFQAMFEAGIFLPPSQFEACFVSAAHSDADIQATLAAAHAALNAIE
ncbi:MAG: glutamate-1-semialdehyde 2,1-aminomutase [Phycisphaerales bacterium]|jgi:glutamate-1-semialdehyde 2,1-aminomutase|nr:glutamate-1-semialdehyde 2,1-aminomutase [Phycisphaerales bacterium]MBT7170808.1 glutamate-1-semialdehyde 2,1-aminomutase [Phycisphaerales bacterium]